MTDAKYKIVDSLFLVQKSDGGIQISVPDEENIEFGSSDADVIITALKALTTPSTVAQLQQALESNGFELDDYPGFMNLLVSLNIVKPYVKINDISTTLSAKQLAKFDRQLKNFAQLPNQTLETAIKFQEQLNSAKVLIVGVGGVGSYLAAGLAQVGTGEIHVLDYASIELSDTSRQSLYDEQDVGRTKVEVAKEKIEKRAPEAKVVTYNMEITSADQMEADFNYEHFDLIIVSADKPYGQLAYIVDQYGQKTSSPVLYGGNTDSQQAYLGPLTIPGSTKRLSELLPKDHDLNDQAQVQRGSAVLDTDHGIAGKMLEAEAVKFLGKQMPSAVIERRVVLNPMDWSVAHYNLNENN